MHNTVVTPMMNFKFRNNEGEFIGEKKYNSSWLLDVYKKIVYYTQSEKEYKILLFEKLSQVWKKMLSYVIEINLPYFILYFLF